jgi:hypothetical protein
VRLFFGFALIATALLVFTSAFWGSSRLSVASGLRLGFAGGFGLALLLWNPIRLYTKSKTEPNQALLPTSTAVTPAADAPVAPTVAAADL